jgi:signal transduction histidine kinase/ligand-binding sensor domain-containing protein
MRVLFFILILLKTLQAQAQQHRFHQYRVEQGLPSDVIKAITEDSLGFLWIATDDGLVKYDGNKFTTYKSALRSQFSKGFLHTKDHKLLVFTDLDLIEIQNRIDTVVFRAVLRGERYLSDSTLSYPKAIYEDKKGFFWIGEPKSVARYDGTKIKRFDFAEETRSPVFVRSFSFFEDDQGVLYTTSYNGMVFRFDEFQNRFLEQKNYRLPDEVSKVLYFKNQLLVAARTGLFSVRIIDKELQVPQKLFSMQGVSDLLLVPDSTILVSTYGEDLYRVRLDKGLQSDRLQYNFNGINSCYLSEEGDLWVATDKGMVIVQKNSFAIADLKSQAQFIEGMAQDEKNRLIFYANKESLVELKEKPGGGWERSVLLDDKVNYFQSLQFGRDGLWASTRWKVLLLKNGRVARSWDFSAEGVFVNNLFIDSKENVWICQAGNSNIKMINSKFELNRFPVEGINQNEINYLQEGDGGIYAVGNGINSYIFFKADEDSVFRNVSVPVPVSVSGDFNVHHLALQDSVFWLASSEGLLKFDKKNLYRLNLGEDFERFPVNSVEVLDRENILFSNSYGLVRYNVKTTEHWVYDETLGMPSNTITDHGIFVTKNAGIWIGTSYGLANATENFVSTQPTRTPYCVEARVNGTPRRFIGGLSAPYEAYLTFQFSAISFPENKVNYQWKMNGDMHWKPLENGHLALSNLTEGTHDISIRAKKNTGLAWSAPASLPIYVSSPYWKKAEFIFLVVLLVILIAWASFAISSAIVNHRKEYLEQQINDRTQELKNANEELTLRNTELDRFVYSASHDLSAPLKSILGLVRVARMDKPGDVHDQYLSMMERSVYKLEEFIQEVVTYSRNTRMPVRFEPINFQEFVKSVLQDHQYSPNFNLIDFRIEDHTDGLFISDATRLKIILNNLLSNAIKFHWIENERNPYVLISLSRQPVYYVLSVKDNGKGIPDEHIGKIFEMFYRATDETQGSGLGLYILKEAVQKLGGTVDAFSKIEVGTQITIALPIHSPQDSGNI